MKKLDIPHTGLQASRIAYGCMQLSTAWDDVAPTRGELSHAAALVELALERGIDLFDHADIYARGKGEQIFGHLLSTQPGLRDRIVLQSKCGIRFAGDPDAGVPARYDFSHAHLVQSVDGILRRLHTDRLDILLLHRPDPLAEPAEVARAFDDLHRSGKVRHFGVSNHSPSQIALLQQYLEQPLVANQIEVSLLHHYPVSEGILANQRDGTYTGANGVLDYCRQQGLLVQAWSPLAGGKLAGPALALAQRMGQARGVSSDAVLLAWLLKHPAPLQPIIGTRSLQRLADCCDADRVELERGEWYALLEAVRGKPVP